MISKQLKADFHLGEPVAREFSALMHATFRYYSETHAEFFDQFPAHLHQAELVSYISVDVKNRLFNRAFCETIPDALKSLRRVIIRLDDLRRGQPKLREIVHDVPRLIALGERVEALYQLHWEYYRYQTQLKPQDLVAFLLEIDNVGKDWDLFQAGHLAVSRLVGTLSGNPLPETLAAVAISYQRPNPTHFALGTLTDLMNFFGAAYRFVCAVVDIDAAAKPLTLLQVEVAEPLELSMALPVQAEAPFRRMLKNLFLKDMFKREVLLKFVFEDVLREFGQGKPLPPSAPAAFQKELAALLKKLPDSGWFAISDRTFPQDGIQVLQEFTKSLVDKKINYEALVKAAEKPKPMSAAPPTRTAAGLDRSPEPAPELKAEAPGPAPPKAAVPTRNPPLPNMGGQVENKKEHIGILTDPK